MKKDPKIMFVLYELEQVDELEKIFDKSPEERDSSVVVALSLDIEDKLSKAGMPHVSAGSYKRVFAEQLSDEDEMMKKLFSLSGWESFVYKEIQIQRIFEFMFRAYLQLVRYHGMQLIRIVEAHPGIEEVRVFPPSEVLTETYGTLAARELSVVVDCLRIIGSQRRIRVSILPHTIIRHSLRKSTRPVIFSAKRTFFGWTLAVWNKLVEFCILPRATRFLVSDHWKNLEPFIPFLKDEEFIFLDRSEIRHINWRLLLKHRMRFVHITHFISKKGKKEVEDAIKNLQEKWNDMRNKISNIFIWNDCALDDLLVNALDDIVDDFPRILSLIEGTYAMYAKMKPHVVELRASVSKQPHFSVLAHVAKKRGIPSLELQHGLEYLGPGSWSREHAAEYMAVYGPLVKKELCSIGYEAEKIFEIGSPRFDTLIQKAASARGQKGPKGGRFTVLCIAPDVRAYEVYDSYSAQDYFLSIAKALEPEKDNVELVIKLRPGPADEMLLRGIVSRVFAGFSYRIAQYDPLPELFKETDIVISCFSTIIVEAMQFCLPVIIPALHPVDEQIVGHHFSRYREAGALFITHSPGEFRQIVSSMVHDQGKREEVRKNADAFMAANFRFDGTSSERYATLMNKLAERSSSRNYQS